MAIPEGSIMRCGRKIVLLLLLIGAGSVAGITRIASAGEPLDDRLGIRTSLLFLVIRADIQTDLALEPAQIAEFNREAPELYRKAMSLKGKKGPGAVTARRAIDEEEIRFLSDHLSPKQRERLEQIDLQWEGASALLGGRPFVDEYLGLTPEQQKQLAAVIAQARAQRPGAGPWTYDEHLAITRKASAVLSEKQRHLWARYLGAPCRFVIATAQPATAAAGGEKRVAPADGR
jgi:hypothetical protein